MAKGNSAKASGTEAGASRSPGKVGGKLKGVAGGRSALAPELDQVIHERVRLAIVSALAVNNSLSFNELKALLKTTDGNLSVHARKLEEAGYVVCLKGYDGRVPRTEFRLSVGGRRALERYLDHMEALIKAARGD